MCFFCAYIFISIKGVQNALKCIKQIEIYYYLNANVRMVYATYVYLITQSSGSCQVFDLCKHKHKSLAWKNLHPFYFHSVFFLFFTLLSLYGWNANTVCLQPQFFVHLVRASTVSFRKQPTSVPLLSILHTEIYTLYCMTIRLYVLSPTYVCKWYHLNLQTLVVN